MNKKTVLWTLMGAMILAACGNDVGTGSSLLRRVDVEGIQTQQLYFVRDVSAQPLTIDQLATLDEDTAQAAIPVRVEVYENVAVAWFAPNGEPMIGRDYIVALWEVVDTSDAQVQSGELRPGAIGSVSPNAPLESGLELTTPIQYGREVSGDIVIPAATVIIDFFDRFGSPEDLRLIQELNRAHPGCA